jgi:hypothetical protein
MPERGGSLDLLKPFANCIDEDFILIAAWLAAALRPKGPYPLLVLSGEQGSAKTTLAKMLKCLIDAHVLKSRSAPRDERDLAIAANNNWAVMCENVSSMPPWLSDAFCRLSTGSGLATRLLYSDDEEALFAIERPVILEGITDFVDRADLMDRCLFIHLAPIADAERRDESEIWASFDAAAPRILGALLDAMAAGIASLPTLRLTCLPRMADFARFGEGVSRALGYLPDEFLESYRGNRMAANETALDDSPVAGAVRTLATRTTKTGFKAKLGWQGTASELLEALTAIVGDKVAESKRWPKSPRSLSGVIRRLAPQLRKVACNVVFHREGKGRTRIIEITPVESTDNFASAPSAPSAARENKGQTADDRNGPPSACVRPPSANSPCETSLADAADAADAKIPDLSGPREEFEL